VALAREPGAVGRPTGRSVPDPERHRRSCCAGPRPSSPSSRTATAVTNHPRRPGAAGDRSCWSMTPRPTETRKVFGADGRRAPDRPPSQSPREFRLRPHFLPSGRAGRLEGRVVLGFSCWTAFDSVSRLGPVLRTPSPVIAGGPAGLAGLLVELEVKRLHARTYGTLLRIAVGVRPGARPPHGPGRKFGQRLHFRCTPPRQGSARCHAPAPPPRHRKCTTCSPL